LEAEAEGGLAVKFSRLSGAALAVAALVAAMVASAAYGITTDTGVSGQPDFKSCISDTGSDTCADVEAMADPSAMALADDESRVFVVSPSDNGVAVFQRDRTTGALKQLKMDSQNNQGGCTREGNVSPCLPGHGLAGANDVVSVGGNAYIASTGSNAVVTLTKDAQSGRWKELDNNGSNQLFCLSTPAADNCAAANGLAGATSITAFGSYVYVGGPGRIAAFHRGTKGALKQLSDEAGCIGTGTGCTGGLGFGTIEDMMISRDGKTLYAVDGSDVLVFQRNKTSGALTQIPSPSLSNVSGPIGVTADQQGTPTSVYVVGSNNVVGVFARNKSTGALTQLGLPDGCVNVGGTSGCTAGPNLGSIGSLTRLFAYKTNRFVYVAGNAGVAAFGRTKSGTHAGALTPLPGTAGCATENGAGGCLPAKGIGGLTDIFSTGGGKHIYVAGTTFDSVVTFHQGG
jgi:hypothetical protein